jgi:acetyl-CoA carboxylase biotin carboxyl carrier protein
MKKTKATAANGNGAPSHADQIAALARVLREHDLNEIEIEEDGRRLYLRRGGEMVVAAGAAPSLSAAAPPAAPPPALQAPPPMPAGGTPPPTAATTDGNVSYITSPFVGTFYRSPGPESAPFVDVGTRFKKGQVICIVEAMKLMNEIEAEVDGTIVAALVDNGHPVEYGEPLFKIKQG